MSRRPFKSSASSGRAAGAFGGFGSSAAQSSVLSYIQEPLDLQAISDPSIVVIFRNLSKKDDTTKAKALDDLESSLDQTNNVEDGILEAWVRLFPRLSIDNNRRVRQLTQNVNGKICSKSGKRIAKHMPQIVGPWLAAQFDGDKTVIRATQDAIRLVFPDPAKIGALRKVYHQAILDYCKNALLQESTSSLSDLRSVSTEDAESTYSRVLSSNMSLLRSLINESNTVDLSEHSAAYAELFDTRTIEYATHTDAGVRRSTHRLIKVASIKLEDVLASQVRSLSDIYLYKGLRSNQTSSSLDYITNLVILTQHYPTLWTDDYTGKKSATSRLAHFLKQGSQGGPKEFWSHLSQLLQSLPAAVLPIDVEGVNELLTATRQGLSRKEDRFHAAEAWQTYQTLVSIILSSVPEEKQPTIIEENVIPLIDQHLFPEEDQAQWTISGAKTATIIAAICHTPTISTVLAQKLPPMTNRLVEMIRLSQPEQARNHDKSQSQVAAAGERWSTLQRELFKHNDLNLSVATTLISEDERIISEALRMCEARNGKPYGAAAIVDSLLRDCGTELIKYKDLERLLTTFCNKSLPNLLATPSSSYLMRCLTIIQDSTEFTTTFQHILETLLGSQDADNSKARLLLSLVSHNLRAEHLETCLASMQLQSFVKRIPASETEANTLSSLLSTGIVAQETKLDCIKTLVNALHDNAKCASALRQLQALTGAHRDLLVAYDLDPVSSNNHLISHLLQLTESGPDEVSSLASDISTRLAISNGNTEEDRLIVVQHALEDIGISSTSMEVLVELALKFLGQDSPASSIISCFPSLDTWKSELNAMLAKPPSSMSICSPLGGVVSLLTSPSTSQSKSQYDADGLSKVLRRAIFFTKLLKSTSLNLLIRTGESADTNVLDEMLIITMASITAAGDKVSISTSNQLWTDMIGAEGELLSSLNEANETLQSVIGNLDDTRLQRILSSMKESSMSAYAYYLTLASFRLTLNEHVQGPAEELSPREIMQSLHQVPLETMAKLVTATQTTPDHGSVLKVVNELIARLTGANFTTDIDTTQLDLITLSSMLNTGEELLSRVPKQRLIFLMKHVLAEVSQTQSRIVGEETLRILAYIFPSIPDIYGEYWAEALDLILNTLGSLTGAHSGTDHIPTLYHTLKLYSILRRLSTHEEVNEDLIEAFKEREAAIGSTLVVLLRTANSISDLENQPLMITNELLSRQVRSLQVIPTMQISNLLPVLYTPSRSIQEAAFSLLHTQIPKQQEQASLDAALDNKTARLPDELLSMLLEAPKTDDFEEEDFDRVVPASLQSFLYSWRLLFDYFDGSSYKVKTDYSDQLKDGLYLSKLLTFTFDFLGHTRGKPVDLSGLDIAQYQADLESDAKKDVRWLLSHLYYLALLNLPSLVKSYVLELRSRQTPAIIEEWTAKYISPSLVRASLQTVSEWSEKTMKEDPEYERMNVKVGTRSKEVNVSYLVDEQTMAIKIVLPDAYPLAPASVLSVSRVAVKEEKWQSWLRNCQGVITFSNGSITDGLSAWRRNVTGALKGQTECAICYSIISGDKQLPTKKCPTCKNLFHSSCLFKWFKTSNASTCPLCRNSFNFN